MSDLRRELQECESLASQLQTRIRELRQQLGEEPAAEVSFGRRLRSLRARHGWTQQRLAEESGLSVNGVIKLENDQTARPRDITLHRLAQALGIDVGELDHS